MPRVESQGLTNNFPSSLVEELMILSGGRSVTGERQYAADVKVMISNALGQRGEEHPAPG